MLPTMIPRLIDHDVADEIFLLMQDMEYRGDDVAFTGFFDETIFQRLWQIYTNMTGSDAKLRKEFPQYV